MGDVANRQRGTVAVVTGAAHGIGAACAARLAAEGASVAVLDLDGDAARERLSDLPRTAGPEHAAFEVDVTDVTSVEKAIAAVASGFGQIDVLVNVAGGGEAEAPFEDSDDEAFQRMLDLNFLGVTRVTRAAVPRLRESERAAVVTVSSINGLMVVGGPAYSAAKAAVHSLTTSLAMRYAPRIRVNAVAPGTTRTRVWDHQGGADRLAHLYPMGRVGEPEDVAAAVAFLASSDAAWITGHILPVDGGLSVRGIPSFSH